jgi:hypothetical protein
MRNLLGTKASIPFLSSVLSRSKMNIVEISLLIILKLCFCFCGIMFRTHQVQIYPEYNLGVLCSTPHQLSLCICFDIINAIIIGPIFLPFSRCLY